MHSAERRFITGRRLLRACGTGPGRAGASPRPRAPGMRRPRRAQARRPGGARAVHSAERRFITGGRLLRACGTGSGRTNASPRPRAPRHAAPAASASAAARRAQAMHSAERPFITGRRLLRACGTGSGRANASPRPRAPGMRRPRRAQARRPGARGRCVPRSGRSSRAGVACVLAGRVRGAPAHRRVRGRRGGNGVVSGRHGRASRRVRVNGAPVQPAAAAARLTRSRSAMRRWACAYTSPACMRRASWRSIPGVSTPRCALTRASSASNRLTDS